MNKSGKSRTKCYKPQRNKELEDMDKVATSNDMKVDIENGNSPQRSCDLRVSGHSTPIRKKDYDITVEDSSELDNRCSPIFLPCTQEGGNEITWDWQSPGKRNSNEKSTNLCNRAETPKRTKMLQRKRNANSPLLQKQFNRKQVKLENIENIGKLSAELKALTERMRSMKQNEESQRPDKEEYVCSEFELQSLDGTIAKIEGATMVQAFANEQKSKTETVGANQKSSSNYEELFDDSIDDSMVKCSQEIEEKLNLCKTKGNKTMELSTVSEEKEMFSINQNDTEYLTTSAHTTGSLKNSISFRNSFSINTSTCLRTYSKKVPETHSAPNIHIANLSDTSLQKKPNNNNIINVRESSVSGMCTLRKENNCELFEIPDDSFDDCLATCIEDENIVSKSSEFKDMVVDLTCDSSYRSKMLKSDTKHSSSMVRNASALASSKKSDARNHSLSRNDKKANVKDPMEPPLNTSTIVEGRRFFKTKSLSDQYYLRGKNTNSSNNVSKTSTKGDAPTKLVLTNSRGSSVNTVLKSQNVCPSSNFPINVTNNVHELDRSEKKNGDSCIVKYKSTGNLYNNPNDGVKDFQRVRCTPEEIERKRLEAKMRLEAKRKACPSSHFPVQRPVKR